MSALEVFTVTEKVDRAGTILMWSLHGAADLAVLRAAWAEAELEEKLLPALPGPTVVLRRAVNAVRNRARIVHPLRKTGGFAVLEVEEGKVTDDQAEEAPDATARTLATATVDMVGRLVVRGRDAATKEAIQSAWRDHAEVLATSDVSDWLVRLMPKLDAVSLRATGGVYFVPHPQIERLNKMVHALRLASAHSIYRIPAMTGDDAVLAIMDAINEEAAKEAEALEAFLAEEELAGPRTEKVYSTRIERADKVESKVARYEGLLGVKLDALRERLDTLRANLTVAALSARTEG